MFDFRTLLGLLLLSIVGLMSFAGHLPTLVVSPDKAKTAEPEKKEPEKKRRLFPWRAGDVKEVAEQTLQHPRGYWNPQAVRHPNGTFSGELVTTHFETFKGRAQVGGMVSPDGAEEVNCDLPPDLWLRNRGGLGPRGPGSGAGLCVFCSINHGALYQHNRALDHIFEWMWDKPGGGWPEKVDEVIKKICTEKNLPIPKYTQIQGKDLAPLELASKTGRIVESTYNFSPTGRYEGKLVAHMVSVLHVSKRWVAVCDNNFTRDDEGRPIPNSIEWMDPATYARVACNGGNYWVFIDLSTGPPAPPRNAG